MISRTVKLLVVILLIAHACYAQTPTAAPLSFTKSQWLDSSGNPLASGKIYTYVAGSASTPLASYTNYTQSGTNANPVVLDSAGRANIFLGPACYKIVAQNSAGVQQWSVDGVCDIGLMLKAGVLSQTGDFLPAVTGTYSIGSNTYQWKDFFASEMIQLAGSSFTTAGATSTGRQIFDNTIGDYMCSISGSTYRRCTPWYYQVNNSDNRIAYRPTGLSNDLVAITASGANTFYVGTSGGGQAITVINGDVPNGIRISPTGFFAGLLGTSLYLGSANGTLDLGATGSSYVTTFKTGVSSGTSVNGTSRATMTADATGLKITQTGGASFQVQSAAAVFINSSGNNAGLWNQTSSATATNLWLLNNGTLVNVLIEDSSTSCQSGTKHCLYLN